MEDSYDYIVESMGNQGQWQEISGREGREKIDEELIIAIRV